jgi:hypothetical protein
VAGGERRLRRPHGLQAARAEAREPLAPLGGGQGTAPADVEHRRHQPLAFAVDVEVTGRRHHLARDRGEDGVELAALEREVERQLQEQVGAVGDAVAPAFAGIEAAVVGERRQIRRRRRDELGALAVRQERLDAIGARDLGERQRGERLAEALAVAVGQEARLQRRPDRLQGGGGERLRARPARDRVEGDPVAQLRVGRREAIEQCQGERLARVVVGDLPLDLLQDLQGELRRRARRARRSGAAARDKAERGGDAARRGAPVP